MARSFSWLAVTLIAAALAACGGGGSDSNSGPTPVPTATPTPTPTPASSASISGSVLQYSQGSVPAGASVEAYLVSAVSANVARSAAVTRLNAIVPPGARPVATVTVQADGSFTIDLPSGQAYVLRIVAPGFEPIEYDIGSLTAASVQRIEPVRLLTEAQATGTASVGGVITNAQTGNPVGAATVKLRAGVGATAGTVVQTATSDSTGTWRADALATGVYTAEVSGQITEGNAPTAFITSYYTVYSVAGSDVASLLLQQGTAVSAAVGAGVWRAVLTWGERPYDLDSHLWSPASTAACVAGNFSAAIDEHIYFAHDVNLANTLNLDVDDVNSFGPETTTILTQAQGDYYFSVHDYSRDAGDPITASQAIVKVYKGEVLRHTFYAPTTGQGGIWDVFKLSGDVITPIEKLRADSLNADVPDCPPVAIPVSASQRQLSIARKRH